MINKAIKMPPAARLYLIIISKKLVSIKNLARNNLTTYNIPGMRRSGAAIQVASLLPGPFKSNFLFTLFNPGEH